MGSVRNLGTESARPSCRTPARAADGAGALAEHDDAAAARPTSPTGRWPLSAVRGELAELTRTGQLHPVFFGSAITGAGVAELTSGIVALLPAAGSDADAEPSGTVFKIEREPGGEKVALIRMFDGTVRIRDRLRSAGPGTRLPGSALSGAAPVRPPKQSRPDGSPGCGAWLTPVSATLGRRRVTSAAAFAPPTLETVVIPARPAEAAQLHQALTELAEQDPLINVRIAGAEISLSLYGEVQKEMIEATLADDYGLRVAFRETTTICIERVVGTGEAATAKDAEDNPFLAGVGLRIEPAPPGSGLAYARDGSYLAPCRRRSSLR